MNTCVLTADENNWRSTFTTLHRQNIIRKLEEAIQKYEGPGPVNKSSIEMENYLYENASSRVDYMSRISQLLLHLLREKKVTSQLPTQSSMNQSRLLNSTVQSNQQSLATNFPLTSNQTISSLQNHNVEMPPGVTIEMGEHMASLQPGQIPSGSMANQINISMPPQMNISIDSPSSTLTITGPVQMTNGNDDSISGSLDSGGRLSNNTEILEKKIVGKHMAHMKHLKGQLSLATSSQLTSALQNGMPGNQTMIAGPMRIKFGRVLYNPITDRMMQLRSQAKYQLIRQYVRGGDSAFKPIIIRSGRPILPSQNSGISSVTFSNQLPMKDEQAYQDKVKELGRYMEPIKKMISIVGIGETEKIVKLKRLLEILSSPHSPRARTTMEALLKIEVVLKKLDLKVAERQIQINEQNRLIDDISLSLQKTSI